MAEVKKVNVCKKCSGFDVTELKGIAGLKVKDTRVGCIGACKQNEGKFWGKLNGELVICDTKEEFFEKITAIL